MKLHISTIEKIINLCENYGGSRNQQRLKDALTSLDLSEYERQTTGEKIIVLTEDLAKEKVKKA